MELNHPQSTLKGSPVKFLLLTFGFTWLILLPGVLTAFIDFDLPLPVYALVAVAQFGPSLAAFYLTQRHEGKKGVTHLLKRAFTLRIHWSWFIIIFILPLAVNAVALWVDYLAGSSLPDMPYLRQPAALIPSFIFILLLQGPVPEEFGWRGYLLERLQARFSPLAASLILGVIWWLWHLPAAFMQGVAQSQFPQAAYLIWCMSLAVLFTWMFNRTGGNLLAALLLHTMLNLATAVFPPLSTTPGGESQAFIYATLLYVLIAVGVVIPQRTKWLAPTDHLGLIQEEI